MTALELVVIGVISGLTTLLFGFVGGAIFRWYQINDFEKEFAKKILGLSDDSSSATFYNDIDDLEEFFKFNQYKLDSSNVFHELKRKRISRWMKDANEAFKYPGSGRLDTLKKKVTEVSASPKRRACS